MSSTLSKPRDYKYIAVKYSEVNGIQVKFGEKLVELLGVKEGEKVLDMGCGTGEVTAFIADRVGKRGQVVGIDPDQERIKVAVQNHCGKKNNNISFTIGNSFNHFPHFNEEYYDIHFSSSVFHWLTAQEKEVFLNTAFKCLKPGGKIAIHSQDKNPEIVVEVSELLPDDEIYENKSPVQFVKKSVTESLLKKSGFVILFSEYVNFEYTFQSLDEFITWHCVSGYVDESKILPHKKEAFVRKYVSDDGTVRVLEPTIYQIVAQKSVEVSNSNSSLHD